MSLLFLSANLSQSGITWKWVLIEKLSLSGWSVTCLWVMFLIAYWCSPLRVAPFTGQVILGYIRNLGEHKCQQTVNSDSPCFFFKFLFALQHYGGLSENSLLSLWYYTWFPAAGEIFESLDGLLNVWHLQFSLFSLWLLLKYVMSQLLVPSCVCCLLLCFFFLQWWMLLLLEL